MRRRLNPEEQAKLERLKKDFAEKAEPWARRMAVGAKTFNDLAIVGMLYGCMRVSRKRRPGETDQVFRNRDPGSDFVDEIMAGLELRSQKLAEWKRARRMAATATGLAQKWAGAPRGEIARGVAEEVALKAARAEAECRRVFADWAARPARRRALAAEIGRALRGDIPSPSGPPG